VSRPLHTDPRVAFEQLFQSTRKDLLAYIVRRASTSEDAADVLAETYLIAWQKLEAVPEGDRARLWLFGVARNVLLRDASRRSSGVLLLERLAGDLRLAYPPHAPPDEQAADVWAALAALAEMDREILTLAAWDGLTPTQIAAVLGCSPNLVRVRLHRARTRLKRQLIAEARERLVPGDGPRTRPARRRKTQLLEREENDGTRCGSRVSS
jgi:RNA polymerase sigma factor (sigma-70 family)